MPVSGRRTAFPELNTAAGSAYRAVSNLRLHTYLDLEEVQREEDTVGAIEGDRAKFLIVRSKKGGRAKKT